jgi:ketosteroid isomerase-like protein
MPELQSDLDPQTEALADRFVKCIEAGDLDGVGACFGRDALIWHNNDSLEVPPEKVLRILAWLADNVTGLRYDVSRRRACASGYVQQHVLRGTAPNGSELAVEACLIVEVVDGRISRLDEYLDTAQVAALM